MYHVFYKKKSDFYHKPNLLLLLSIIREGFTGFDTA